MSPYRGSVFVYALCRRWPSGVRGVLGVLELWGLDQITYMFELHACFRDMGLMDPSEWVFKDWIWLMPIITSMLHISGKICFPKSTHLIFLSPQGCKTMTSCLTCFGRHGFVSWEDCDGMFGLTGPFVGMCLCRIGLSVEHTKLSQAHICMCVWIWTLTQG